MQVVTWTIEQYWDRAEMEVGQDGVGRDVWTLTSSMFATKNKCGADAKWSVVPISVYYEELVSQSYYKA